MSILAEPSVSDVQMLVEDVWSSFLGAEEPLLPGMPAEFPTGWSAAVTVTGEWEGMVSVEVPTRVAEEVTRRMLCLDDGPLADEDVADAVGELVNMIGGNVKSLMPGPSTLSLPLVAHTVLEAPSELRPRVTLDLAWRAAPVRVRVLATP